MCKADTLQTLFTTDADQAAREAHFIRRRRKLSGASFAQALVFSPEFSVSNRV